MPQGGTYLAALNVKNRTLFIKDNLPILRGINSESVDLIATDPPFNKGVKAFEGIVDAGVGKGGKKVSYKDVWTWNDVDAKWLDDIREQHQSLASVIDAANVAAGEDMGAFLCWLAVRVLECHRILKPTGSMYLHCDHTAGAWIKAMMDAIFERKNFRNEIVWGYTGPSNTKRWFPRKHDVVLFYAKSDKAEFNRDAVRVPYKEESFTMGGSGSLATKNRQGDYTTGREEQLAKGKIVEDYWTDIPSLSVSNERTGYPTQKPLALYERIIKASSKDDAVVLDPFAGCATTCVAAESLGRHWVGIDINKEAREVLRSRLQKEVRFWSRGRYKVNVARAVPKRTDDGKPAAPELTLVSSQPKAPSLTARELRERLVLQDGLKCQGCGWIPHHADYLENDHNVPKAHGGRDDIRNRVLLCAPCNGVKSKKLTLAELRERRIGEGRMMDAAWNREWYEKVGRHGAPA